MDILIFSALTEEHQVICAILDDVAKLVSSTRDVRTYEFITDNSLRFTIGVCSAHLQGSAGLSSVATQHLQRLHPKCAALIGIAAAVDTGTLALGDVPFTTQVMGTDDVSVEDGTLTFRSEGFQCDSRMRSAFGALRSDQSMYRAWQIDCLTSLPPLVYGLNTIRRTQIVYQSNLSAPHIDAGTTAGTPFLIRDINFRNNLRNTNPEYASYNKIVVSNPLHPKLLSTEMESHGFMRAAAELQVPAVVLKGISDDGDANKSDLEKESGGFYRVFACSNALRALLFSLNFNPFANEANFLPPA